MFQVKINDEQSSIVVYECDDNANAISFALFLHANIKFKHNITVTSADNVLISFNNGQ